MYLIVNEWKVGCGWSLSYSSKFIVNWSVTKANPPLVGSKIWHWNTSQVSTNSRTAKNWRVSGIRNWSLRLLIEHGGCWESIGLIDLRLCETSDENKLSIPRGLKNLTWWEFWNIEFLIGITNISASSDHLRVENSDESLDSETVVSKNESLDHVELGTSDFIVTVLLIPKSKLITIYNLFHKFQP